MGVLGRFRVKKRVINALPAMMKVSLRVVSEIAVTQQRDEGTIKVGFRATPPEKFRPNALDGAQVKLFVPDQDPLAGLLKLQSSSEARGLWFSYVIEFDDSSAASKLHFCGVIQFSNVVTVEVRGHGYFRTFRNPFFHATCDDSCAISST